jgi:hypothetical protein
MRAVKRRSVLFALGVLLSLAGCDSPVGLFGGDVEIRIANNSSFRFERVDAVFPEDEVSYGAISANSLSSYRTVSAAYRYAYIEVQVNGEELRIQPIDYVGENKLGAGRYTYVLNVTIEGYLTLDFQED